MVEDTANHDVNATIQQYSSRRGRCVADGSQYERRGVTDALPRCGWCDFLSSCAFHVFPC